MTFGTAKFVLHIQLVIGWVFVVIGLIIFAIFVFDPTGPFSTPDEFSFYLSHREAIILGLAPTLSCIVSGVLIVAVAQIGFAIIATAENTAETASNIVKILTKNNPPAYSDPPIDQRKLPGLHR